MEIKFVPVVDYDLIKPIPAIYSLPDWYKQLSPHIEGKKDSFDQHGNINATIKRCNPVGDAFSSGYFLLLQNAISVAYEDGKQALQWHGGDENFISTHSQEQIHKDIVPVGFSKIAYKFRNDYSIQTPKGYSTLFTHPLNRAELPFYTLQGVVDTDTYHNTVNFPFFLKEGFEGVIEAGTPIAQVIPIKRDSWTHFVGSPNPQLAQKYSVEHKKFMPRWYKKLYWNKKQYK